MNFDKIKNNIENLEALLIKEREAIKSAKIDLLEGLEEEKLRLVTILDNTLKELNFSFQEQDLKHNKRWLKDKITHISRMNKENQRLIKGVLSFLQGLTLHIFTNLKKVKTYEISGTIRDIPPSGMIISSEA